MSTSNTKPDPAESFREGVYYFNGKPLRPFSYWRQEAALAMGLRFGRLTPEELEWVANPDREPLPGYRERLRDLEALPEPEREKHAEGMAELRKRISELEALPEKTMDYPRAMKDAAIVLWLCSDGVPDSKALKAERRPDDFQMERAKWAEENGLGINGPKSREALNLMATIVSTAGAMKAAPDIPKANHAGPDEEDDDPN